MHISKKLTIGLVAFGLALVGAGTTFAAEHEEHESKEQKIALQDCPPAVQQSIQAQAGDGTVTKVEKYAEEDGTVVYEAKIKKAGGDKIEVKVGSDGKVLSSKADDDDDDDAKPAKKHKDDDDDDDEKPKK